MELLIKVEKLGDEQFMDADNQKDITVTGRILSMHFKDGAVQELMDKAQKYDELSEAVVSDIEKEEKQASDLMMPNFCPYCGSQELYEPNPRTGPNEPYCDDCGANIKKVSKQEYYLNAEISLTQELIQDGIPEGFQDYARSNSVEINGIKPDFIVIDDIETGGAND